MELFFTRANRLELAICVDGEPLMVEGRPYVLPKDARVAMEDEVVPDGMPFLLGDEGDYDKVINKFFRDLPFLGCGSVNTWRAYARDIVTFCRFLSERRGGKHLLNATVEDVRQYYRTRRLTGLAAVAPETWNRGVTALQKFFEWALEEKRIIAVPFTYKTVVMRRPGTTATQPVQHNTALERVGSDATIKCVSLDDYIAFRDIGLLGYLPEGGLDPNFRGRNRLRNAAFAELLVTTGIRLEEGGSMLKEETPDAAEKKWLGFRSCKMRLAKLTTKGDKGRPIWVPKRVLNEHIYPYIQEERDNAVCRATDCGAYETVLDALHVSAWRRTGCTIQQAGGRSQKIPYDQLSPGQRRQMFSLDHNKLVEPGCLWLTETGMPTALNNFEAVFARACNRCQGFGIDLWITPHVLRHTFAVYMLSNLIKGVLDCSEGKYPGSGESVYRKVISDPLRSLQRMLGHASITTTYKYLTYIEESEEQIDAAVGSWGDRLGSPSDHIYSEEAA
ncbi:site-specific integrase [Rhodoblastus sp. 17X3]|uniref:tyrosine-type recombinase/integrase n=1 Tax=Rhodoblastus sp. 17X3 TaxID=3047026 RepID=UPI0024B6376E|nr:site-specific integrase [Rhodoblastus sp. 17X3]MDI9847628.1 site-specific integrase [Rhodoblastus sp. 17X3]